MSQVVASELAASTGPSANKSQEVPAPTPEVYTFVNVLNCKGGQQTQVAVTFKQEWAAYWTVDHRVCDSDRKQTCFRMCFACLAIPNKIFNAIIEALCEVAVFLVLAVPRLLLWLFVPMIQSCLFKRSEPVATLEQFYYWLKRNGFTSRELDVVKKATKGMCLHQLLVKLTDVRDVENFFQLKAMEKQKAVVVVLSQSREVIQNNHQKELDILRGKYGGQLLSWAATSAYLLGDVVARNGPSKARKQKDWPARVAGKVDLRVNAVLRCINTVAKEAKYNAEDKRMVDLVRTMGKTNDPVDWEEFAVKNNHHDNKLWAEFHTAAPFVKQYVTQSILDETKAARTWRQFLVWAKKLVMISIGLAKIVIEMDLSSIEDIVDLVLGAITELAEDPVGFLEIVIDNGLGEGADPSAAAEAAEEAASGGGGDGLADAALDKFSGTYGRDARMQSRMDKITNTSEFVNVTELAKVTEVVPAQPTQP